jgi:23S rRNA pseudouridine1911/1915/1917 synthase
MRETVPEGLAGERLDRAVAMMSGASRSEVAAAIGAGTVRVNGAVVTKVSMRLADGDVVEGDVAPAVRVEAAEPDVAVDVPVVHVDDDVLVVDKPVGLVVHPGAGNRNGTLVQGLLVRYPELAEVGEPHRPGVVHRLDKGTSGLLVVARSRRAYESLVAQLSTRRVERVYAALVLGTFEVASGVVDAPIGRSGSDPTRMAVASAGREARTRYDVVGEFTDPVPATLVECRLETGRTHQIRVHLAAIGHPVVGDDAYGGARSSLPAPRPLLHARRLAFEHPGTGETMAFESPLPDDFEAVLAGLSARPTR